MTQPADILAPAIGACLNCRQLFLVTSETPNCILCGRPPAYTLPFPAGEPELTEGPETPSTESAPLISREEAITHFRGLGYTREEAEKELGPEQPAAAVEEGIRTPVDEAPEEEEEEEVDDLGVLLTGIGVYLADAGITGDDIHTWLTRMGAEPEAASTAVGRLSAVRELLERLSAAREPAPVAPAQPEITPP